MKVKCKSLETFQGYRVYKNDKEAKENEEVVRQADLILTGEGKLDRQTGMGKALDGILRVGEKCQVPVIALGGAVEATEALNRMGFTAVLPIQPFPVTLEEAMRPEFTKENIERTVRQVVRIIKQFTK